MAFSTLVLGWILFISILSISLELGFNFALSKKNDNYCSY